MIKKSYKERWGHNRTRKAQGSANRKRRREEAEKRQAKYDNLTLEEKIQRAKLRPGNCAKELARLEEM